MMAVSSSLLAPFKHYGSAALLRSNFTLWVFSWLFPIFLVKERLHDTMSACVGAFVPHYCSSLGMPDVTIVSLSLCVSSLVVFPYLDGT